MTRRFAATVPWLAGLLAVYLIHKFASGREAADFWLTLVKAGRQLQSHEGSRGAANQGLFVRSRNIPPNIFATPSRRALPYYCETGIDVLTGDR